MRHMPTMTMIPTVETSDAEGAGVAHHDEEQEASDEEDDGSESETDSEELSPSLAPPSGRRQLAFSASSMSVDSIVEEEDDHEAEQNHLGSPLSPMSAFAGLGESRQLSLGPLSLHAMLLTCILLSLPYSCSHPHLPADNAPWTAFVCSPTGPPTPAPAVQQLAV